MLNKTKNQNEKTKQQLGVNKSTAQAILLKDILWKLIQETNQTKCFVCGEEMTRETFSIEHKEEWLNKENAKELFFDLNNISFSHLSCNISRSSKRKRSAKHGTSTMYNTYKCRCDLCRQAANESKRKSYSKEKRRERYLTKGY